jgi:hypothetical protein
MTSQRRRNALRHKPPALRRSAPDQSATPLPESTILRMCEITLLADYAAPADKRAAAGYVARQSPASAAIYYLRIAAMTDEQIESGAAAAVLEALLVSHGYIEPPED